MMMNLTFDDVDQLLAYDPETGELRWKMSTNRRIKAGSGAGCVGGNGYLQVKVHGKMYQAHRLAWLLHTGKWPSQQLDHIDGCKTNNRISNLRECSNAENQQNRGKSSNNTSGVPGVYWHKEAKKWRARIMLDGKQISLGLFNTLEEAAAAREAAKAQHHPFQPTDRS
ncbi:HNH endonuclease family protein [Xanthomonas phage OP1]|uniref:HNH endonuclease family protein n=1 Tax=Xanthomonas phage OP1 TaxID=2994040 RepID=Q2NPG0_9CAUD|nr:HNH endonuclease [Xanthomonas phage OP1]BAE72736.1 HNH endonuclease family protein [Xanthomonas phage OP1]